MQGDLKEIEATGIQVVGVSYDPVQVLSGFADKHQITFPLLSDSGSKTIRAYGLLNKEATGKAEIPYSANRVVLGQNGVIRAKLFLEGFRNRHTTEAFIKEAAKEIK